MNNSDRSKLTDKSPDCLPTELPDNPMHIARSWLGQATDERVQRNPNAMVLATVDDSGQPSARVVLCKAFDADAGFIVFYTNYESRKSAELIENPNVSLVFHWDSLGRQIRIEGIARRSPAQESDAYFASRPRGSQLGAWGSDQSRPVASRDALLAQVRERSDRLDKTGSDIARPAHWGGIRVWATAIELWVDAANRVHDRARWTRTLGEPERPGFDATPWTGTRLQP